MMLSLGVEPIGYSSADISKDMLRRAKFDDPAEQIPYLGQYLTTQLVNLGDRHSPSLEVLTQLQPDLILGETWQGSQGKYSLLSKIAPTVLVDDQKGGWEHSIEIINQALDKEEKLRQVKNDYRARIATVREQLALVASKFPQILLVSSGDLSRAIYPYEDSEFSRLFEELNFQLVNTENFFSDNSGLSLETVPQLNADIIIVVAWNDDKKDDARGWEKLEQEWGKIPVLDNMAASQAGRVFFLDARLSTIRGPLAAGVILDSYLRVLTPLKKQ
jgi:iron complex transport system substrate-binding protein